jgi:ubiquitin-conjugating enzyme E2 variant
MKAARTLPPVRPYSRAEIALHCLVAAPNAVGLWLSCSWLIEKRVLLVAERQWLPLATFVGLLGADFVSGFLHWMFDTWFDDTRPYLRRMVVMVREHHLRPNAIFEYPWHHDAAPLALIGTVVSTPLLWPALCGGNGTALACLRVWCGVTLDLLVVSMLELHKLGHRRSAVGPLGWLQACHIGISPKHHAKHHRGGHDRCYCIVSGLMDYVLDAARFWRILESFVSYVTGAAPRRDDQLWREHGLAKAPKLRQSQGYSSEVSSLE